MKNKSIRSLTLSTCLVLVGIAHAQVQNFLFAGMNVPESSFVDPCQVLSDITVTTSDANSSNEVHHSLYENALWIPSSGDNDPATEILVTIKFDPPVNSPKLWVGDLDYKEWYHSFSSGFTGIDPSPGVHFVNGEVRTIGQLYSYDWNCTLNWTGCQDSISFIYHRPTDLNITLNLLAYSVCTTNPPLPTNELEFYMNTDANSADVHWEIRRAGCPDPVCAGDGYANSSACQIETCFLEDGDYELTVFNDDGDAFTGQYVLRSVDGGRIVDNPDGFQPANNVSHGGIGAFSVPMGTTRMQENLLDNLNILNNTQPAFKTNNYTGYAADVDWMVFDADGGVPLHIPGQIVRGTDLYDLVTAGSLVKDKVYNVRAISGTGTGSIDYGPATTFMIPTADYHTNNVLCLPSRLTDNPATQPTEHSCNVERTANDEVWAPYRAGFSYYRYVWTPLNSQIIGDLVVTRMAPGNGPVNRHMKLGVTDNNTTYTIDPMNTSLGAPPATYGIGSWMVRVQSRKLNGNWCGLGECCRVTIIEGFQDPQGEKSLQLKDEEQPLVWPNPNNGGQLFMDLAWTASRTIRVEMVDVFGRLVLEEQLVPQSGVPNSIKVGSRMSAGTYMIRITDGNEVRTTRLVISQ